MSERVRRRARVPIGAVLAVGATALAACGGGGGGKASVTAPPPATSTASAPDAADAPKSPGRSGLASKASGWANGDLSNTRFVKGEITAANFKDLEQDWSMQLAASSPTGSYAGQPIVVAGVLYSQDLNSDVEAIDVATGDILWSKEYGSPNWGPNGIAVVGSRVYGNTSDSAFALDRRTGRELWKTTLVTNPSEGIDMAPGYHDGRVFVSTVPGNTKDYYKGGTSGVLYALDAETGKKLWTFDTAPLPKWSRENTKINTGGGLWHPPAFDAKGDMYFGVGNPGPFTGTDEHPWGASRPGRNLYTDSLVKLDAKTGKLRWYFQLTPHDVYDWDLQNPPILTTVKGRPAAVTSGKSGIVVAVARDTGKLLWKRPVGKHNGHDGDNLLALRRQYDKLELGVPVYPGYLGGVIAPMASDGSIVAVPVVNQPTTYVSQGEPRGGGAATGEVDAIDVDTGKRLWRRALPTPAFGAATIVNDLVIVTTYDGSVYGFDKGSGKQVGQLRLPARTNTGVGVAGDRLIAPAGVGQNSAIVVYRLPASGG